MLTHSLFWVLLGLVIIDSQWNNPPYRHADQFRQASDYKDLQLWAKQNTTIDTVFMPEPTHYYGWRHFSQRSSFGNVREWLLSGWFYQSDLSNLKEGLRRFNEFGLNLEDYLNFSPRNYGFGALHRKMHSLYYSELGDKWFKKIGHKYGVSFAVFNKKFRKNKPTLPIAYENDSYFLVKIGDKK